MRRALAASALVLITLPACSLLVDPRRSHQFDLVDGDMAPDAHEDAPPACVPGSREECDGRDNDCDGSIDGVAASLACGLPGGAAAALCAGAECLVAECTANLLDCNAGFSDGCEVDPSTDAAHCGDCMTSCAAGEACDAGVCSTVLWSRVFGSPLVDRVEEVAVSASGDLFVVGAFSGVGDFGTGPTATARAQDGFVASYARDDGAPRFARTFGSPGNDVIYAIAAGADGSLVIGGAAQEAIDLGGGALRRGAGDDGFAAALDADGDHRWSVGLGGSGLDLVNDVAVDASGNVFVAGLFSGTIQIGGASMTSRGATDGLVASFRGDGTFRWSRQIGGAALDGIAMSVAADGTVYVAGYFSGTIDLGGGPLSAIGGSDIVLASFDGLGSLRWARRYGSAGADGGWSVDVASPERVVVSGYFSQTVTIGEGGPSLTSRSMQDLFVAVLDASGNTTWATSIPGAGNEGNVWVDGNAAGEVLVAATFDSEIEIGEHIRPVGDEDSIAISYAADGSLRWAHVYGSPDLDGARDVAWIGSDAGALVGVFDGPLEIGSGRTISASGGLDGFVIAFPR